MKIDFKIEHGTYMNAERSSYPENNEPYEFVRRPLVKLIAKGILIEEILGLCGSTKIDDYQIKSLEATAKSVLDSKSIKRQRERQKKIIAKGKKDFDRLLKSYNDESIARERFALERLDKLNSQKLKGWKTFEWKYEDKLNKVMRLLEEK